MNKWQLLAAAMVALIIGGVAYGLGSSNAEPVQAAERISAPSPSVDPDVYDVAEEFDNGTGGHLEPGESLPESDEHEWQSDEVEEAADVYGNSIRRSHPTELRLAAGRCAVKKLMKVWPTYAQWLEEHEIERFANGSTSIVPVDVDLLFVELDALGTCDLKVGI